MKKVFSVIASILAILFYGTACTKDVSTALVGEWHLTRVHSVQKVNGTKMEESDNYTTDAYQLTLLLNDNGKCQMLAYMTGVYERVDYDWLYLDGKLVLTSGTGTKDQLVFDVNISNKKLELTQKEEQLVSGNRYELINMLYFDKA